MIAEVIINTKAKSLNKTLDYIIPEELVKSIEIGNRVLVPLRNKIEEGYVVGIKEISNFANKKLISIEDKILTKQNIEFSSLMARRYFCNISDCIKLMLPPGDRSKNIQTRVKEKTANFVYLKSNIEEIKTDIELGNIKSKKHTKILEFLIENDGIDLLDLENILKTTRTTLKKMEELGYIEIVEKRIERNTFKSKKVDKDKPFNLTHEQQVAFEKIKDSKYKEFLIYGITGSRQNRNIFTANSKYHRKRKKGYNACARNIINSADGRKIFSKIWK